MPERRLIVCFDGTWNTPDDGAKPTNVVKILRAIRNQDGEVPQITFYDKGVGTGGFLDRIVGGASGRGLTANMVDGYRFLANNHEPDDEIYLFGFSRGAYTARSLLGFIGLAGLFSPLHLGGALAQAVAIYRDEKLSGDQKRARIDRLGVSRHHPVRVRCIGVWDTVGALGIPGDLGRRLLGRRYCFHDVQLTEQVDVALHALAIDEKRSAFAPTLWIREQTDSHGEGERGTDRQTVEQVWFPGVHSNVGGSYDDPGLSDIALDWMVNRLRDLTDLALSADYLREHVRPNVGGKGVESRSPLYKDSVFYPYQRLLNQAIPEGKGFGEWFRTRFPVLDRRNVSAKGTTPINEMLHVSALERWGQAVMHDCPEGRQCDPVAYEPANLKAALQARNAPVVGWDGSVCPAMRYRGPRCEPGMRSVAA